MERGLALCSCISHETFRFNSIRGMEIRVSSSDEKDFQDPVIQAAVGVAECCMKRCFSGLSGLIVYVGSML